MHDVRLAATSATVYSVGAGFFAAYAGQLACVAALNGSRFRSWAGRTYGVRLSRREAYTLLHGRWAGDMYAAVAGGFTFLHSAAGELPRLALPTAEIPVVRHAGAERG